ncbi:hypothetical protein M0804_000639 [Polistes exclamans]|nr:hypothetical protein M0804_000639 [Polistes exclamans]
MRGRVDRGNIQQGDSTVRVFQDIMDTTSGVVLVHENKNKKSLYNHLFCLPVIHIALLTITPLNNAEEPSSQKLSTNSNNT